MPAFPGRSLTLLSCLLTSSLAVAVPVSDLYARYGIELTGHTFTSPLDGPNAPARSYDSETHAYEQNTNTNSAQLTYFRGTGIEIHDFGSFDAQLTAQVDATGAMHGGILSVSGSSSSLGIDSEILLLANVVDWGWEGHHDGWDPQPLPDGLCDVFDAPCATAFLYTATLAKVAYVHPALEFQDYLLWSQSANTTARELTSMADFFTTDLYAGGAPLNTYLYEVTAKVSETPGWLLLLPALALMLQRTNLRSRSPASTARAADPAAPACTQAAAGR